MQVGIERIIICNQAFALPFLQAAKLLSAGRRRNV